MFCPKCGNQLPDDARFCNKCGNTTDLTGQTVGNGAMFPAQGTAAAGKASKGMATPVKISIITSVAVIVVVGVVLLLVHLLGGGLGSGSGSGSGSGAITTGAGMGSSGSGCEHPPISVATSTIDSAIAAKDFILLFLIFVTSPFPANQLL